MSDIKGSHEGVSDRVPAHTFKWDAALRDQFPEYVNELERAVAAPDLTGFWRERLSVRAGDRVCLEDANGRSFVDAASKRVRVGKRWVSLAGGIGQPLGTVLSADRNGELKHTHERTVLPETEHTDAEMEVRGDNSSLVDDGGRAQRLSSAEIAALKAEKADTPEELVALIAQHSDTFASKTEFSQEKYLKRKRKKYSNLLRLAPATLRAVAAHLFAQAPARVLNLRFDSLAQMLTAANVYSAPGRLTLVVDHAAGLLVAGAAQRHAGRGHVVVLHRPAAAPRDVTHGKRSRGPPHIQDASPAGTSAGAQQPVPFLRLSRVPLEAFNRVALTPAARACVVHASLAVVAHAFNPSTASASPVAVEPQSATSSEAAASEGGLSAVSSSILSASVAPSSSASSAPSSAEQQATALALLRDGGAHSLLVASRYDPVELLFGLATPSAASVAGALWGAVRAGGCVAIHSSDVAALARCAAILRSGETVGVWAAHVRLGESWLRAHQVLPARTHPTMNSLGHGGFILSAMKLAGSSL